MTSSADAKESASLEDVMVAMDVVDTLRHRQELVQQELGKSERREALIKRLREIYAAQGIHVTDELLSEGVEALEQDRFHYEPPKKTFAVRLARFYIKRGRWAKPIVLFALFITIAFSHNYCTEVRPEQQAYKKLPNEIDQLYQNIRSIAKEEKPIEQARQLSTIAKQALAEDDLKGAKSTHKQLSNLYATLNQSYRIDVVNKPERPSGIWRVPDVNSNARNYYLVVQAVDSSGKVVPLTIRSEENGQNKTVSRYGVRVEKSIFDKVARDKNDDGIIQGRTIGEKKRGFLSPNYSINTTGAAIYAW